MPSNGKPFQVILSQDSTGSPHKDEQYEYLSDRPCGDGQTEAAKDMNELAEGCAAGQSHATSTFRTCSIPKCVCCKARMAVCAQTARLYNQIVEATGSGPRTSNVQMDIS